jgi:competence protein ComEC
MGLHKSQVFFYLLSAFICGVFVASVFGFSISAGLILGIIGVSIIALGYQNKLILLVGFLILVFSIGELRFGSFENSGTGTDDLIGQEIVLLGYVDSEPDIDISVQRFVWMADDRRILVIAGTYPRFKYGDYLEISGKLKLPKNFSEEFDYVTYLKKDGIRTTLFFPEIKKYDGNLNLPIGRRLKVEIYKNIFRMKEKFETAINKSISEPNAAFINGILLGTRQNIPDDLKDAFSKTGTTHILAISGYNIMIISEAVLLGLIFFFKRRISFWISVMVIIAFVILTGASASVVRAAIMGLLLSFANGYGRLYDQKNSIILAGGVMIWLNPYVLVFDIGFQLSFAAVLGLIYLYPYIDRKLYKIKESGAKELILMTLSAQVTVAPLIFYYFGNFSLISLPANILILPFIPYAMIAGFITGLSGMFYLPVGQFIGYMAWAITSYQIWVVRLLS